MCLPALTAVSASALQSFTCVLASLCICLHLACTFVSLCLHLSPSSRLLWPPLPCNPLSPSSGRRRLQSVPIRKTQTVWGLRWCNHPFSFGFDCSSPVAAFCFLFSLVSSFSIPFLPLWQFSFANPRGKLPSLCVLFRVSSSCQVVFMWLFCECAGLCN